jgi:hypothetical protein
VRCAGATVPGKLAVSANFGYNTAISFSAELPKIQRTLRKTKA